ncbi:MAG: C40 family peptidase [Saccharofermentans sp.]|nr:C40 family peptidase [Saccharofermentans sp.]
MRFGNFVKAVSLVLTTSIVLGVAGATRYVAAAGITLSGSSNVQRYGDIDGVWDDSSATLTLKGNTDENKEYRQIEAITVNLNNSTGFDGSLQYSVYVQSKGWQEFKSAGNEAGTRNKGLRIDGIKMELTGALASKYTVQYSVQLQKNDKSQGYVSDGTVAGSPSDSRMIEEIKIRIVPANEGTSTTVNYRAHRESLGWGSKWSKDGSVAGQQGKAKQIDSLEMNLTGNQYKGGIEYRSKVQKTGLEKNWSSNGMTSGTPGKKTDAVAIRLTGDVADHYDIYYRVCVQSVGWLGWAKNGAETGVTDLSYKLEAIQVVLVNKGGAAPGNVGEIKSIDDITQINPRTPLLPGAGLFRMGTGAKVSYAVKSAAGWSEIKSDGEVLEVAGPITGIAVGVNTKSYVKLCVNTPDFGEPVEDLKDSYDTDFALNIIDAGKRIESLDIYSYYDAEPELRLYYRVKTSKEGWMAWAPEANPDYPEDLNFRCGTDEVGQTISAIQLVMLPENQRPAKDYGGITSDNDHAYLTMEDYPAPYLVTTGNKFAAWCLKTFPQKYSDPYQGLFRQSKNIKYRYGGSSKKGCDCSGFVVYVMRKYFHKKVYHGMYKLSHKTGKNISYSQIRPGDWLCDYHNHHGWVHFYVGKDNYGHDVVLSGYTPGSGILTPTFEYWDIQAWLKEPKHALRRK